MRRFWSFSYPKPNSTGNTQEIPAEVSNPVHTAFEQEELAQSPSTSHHTLNPDPVHQDFNSELSNPNGFQDGGIQNVEILPNDTIWDGPIPLNPIWANSYYQEVRQYADSINLVLVDGQALFPQILEKAVLDSKGQVHEMINGVVGSPAEPHCAATNGNSNPNVVDVSTQDGNYGGGFQSVSVDTICRGPIPLKPISANPYEQAMRQLANSMNLVLLEGPLLPQIVEKALQDTIEKLGQIIQDVDGSAAEPTSHSAAQSGCSNVTVDPPNMVENPSNTPEESKLTSSLIVPGEMGQGPDSEGHAKNAARAPVKAKGTPSRIIMTRSASARQPEKVKSIEMEAETGQTTSEDSDSESEVVRPNPVGRGRKRPRLFSVNKGKSPKQKYGGKQSNN